MSLELKLESLVDVLKAKNGVLVSLAFKSPEEFEVLTVEVLRDV